MMRHYNLVIRKEVFGSRTSYEFIEIDTEQVYKLVMSLDSKSSQLPVI